MQILKLINCHLNKPVLFFTKLCLGDVYRSCIFITFHTEKDKEHYGKYSEISVINKKYLVNISSKCQLFCLHEVKFLASLRKKTDSKEGLFWLGPTTTGRWLISGV